jgi:hypothetical protein
MITDHTDYCVPDLLFIFIGTSLCTRLHAQIGTKHIDPGLSLCRPFVSESRQGVYTGESHCRSIVTKLFHRPREPIRELLLVGAVTLRLGEPLATIADDETCDRT